MDRTVSLAGALREERRVVVRALVAGCVVSVSTVLLAASSAWLIVRAAERPVILSLTVLMGLVQLFALAKAAGRYLERTLTHRAVLGAMARLRAQVSRAIEPLVPAGLGPRPAEAVEVVIDDVDRTQELLTSIAAPLVAAVVAGLVAALCAALVDGASGVALTVGLAGCAIVVPVVAARVGAHGEMREREVREQLGALVADATETGDEYRGVGAYDALVERIAQLDRELTLVHARQARLRGLVVGLGALVAAATLVACALTAIDALAAGEIARALVAIPALTAVAALELLNQISPALLGWRGNWLALTRLERLADVEAPVEEPGAISRDVSGAREVTLRDVGHRFGVDEILSHVDLAVGPREFVVVRGPSGSGKSTLSRILARFVDPTTGEALLGTDPYPTLTSSQVRERIGLVDDEPHIFSTTLAANVRLGRESASDDEIRDALSRAGLDALLVTLPEGLDTTLGGAHGALSGGERRRLGVAREMLAHRPIALYDEPTEGLDETGAAQLIATLREHHADSAAIVISHRDADVSGATRVLAIDRGRLTDETSTPAR